MKKITILFLVAHLVPILLFAQKTGAEMVSDMGRGINLGNVLSAPAEGDWAVAVTEQYFIDVKNAALTSIGTFTILNPKKAQAMSPEPPGTGW